MITPETYLTLHQQHADAAAYDEVWTQVRAGIIEPGVYRHMPAAHYHSIPALSNSGMGDLEVSPYRYWYLHKNPGRPPDQPTDAQRLGQALHVAVLEHDSFLDRYNCQVNKADFDGCLDTVADLKAWLIENGGSTKGPNKPDYIKEIVRVSKAGNVPVRILDLEMSRHAAANQGKTLLNKVEWERVNGMARALLSESALKPLLADGERELSIFVRDPESGLLLKCRVDWLQQHQCQNCKVYGDGKGKLWKNFSSTEVIECDTCAGTGFSDATVVDPKSFSAREYTIDEAVARAYRYNGYMRQAWFYTFLLRQVGFRKTLWINSFVESDAPYEVRLRALGNNLTATAKYWETTGMQVLRLIRLYAKSVRDFGDKPWCREQVVRPLEDKEVPGIAFRSEQEIQ